MYVYPTIGHYDRNGEQSTRRGLFLILMSRGIEWKDGKAIYHKEIRGIVRKVALRQFGHWMAGSARVKGNRLHLSGSYGNDGLTVTVPQEVFEEGIPLPDDLHEAWNKGGGHNSAGTEGPAMREWARKNMRELYRVGNRCRRS